MPAMPTRSSKPRAANQMAKAILDQLTGDAPKEEPPPAPVKNAAAVALGRLGGKKGGAARAAALTPEQRSEIARKAAAGRWKMMPSATKPQDATGTAEVQTTPTKQKRRIAF